jgi:hypothetical protein
MNSANVEHRYYPRIPSSLGVDLFKNGRHIGSAKAKNISLGGMLLQSDQSTLDQNDVILLRMWIEGAPHRLNGFVIHASPKQNGIMLIGMCKNTSRAYFNFLRDMTQRQSQADLEPPLREISS